MISETKADHSFLDGQFILGGFETSFRLDQNGNSGGIILFIRNDIPVKVFYTDDSPLKVFM